MIQTPRLKRHLHVAFTEADETTLLIGEGRSTAVTSSACTAVLGEIDGKRSSEEVVNRLIDRLPVANLYAALHFLEQNGHIEEASDALPDRQAAYWNTLGIDTATAAGRLGARRVSLIGLGHGIDALETMLGNHNVGIARDGWGDLRVAVVDDYLHPGLSAINDEAIARGAPWIIVKPDGIFVWIGPLMQAGETGCWECLAQRLRGQREVESFALNGSAKTSFPALAALPGTRGAGLAMAAIEIAKWCASEANSVLEGAVVTFDTLALETRRHILTRRPQCPACGDPDAFRTAMPRPVTLQSVTKGFTADGGHRSVAPEETLRRHEHLVGPVTGITRGLARITPEDGSPLHVYTAGVNLATRHDTLQRMRRGLRTSCCGKGTTDVQARASSLGETAERYSGVYRGEEYSIAGTIAEIGPDAIDPRETMLFSKRQYAERERWNALDRRLDMVPVPFDPAAQIHWTPLWSLTDQRVRWMPTAQCFYSTPQEPDHAFCLPDSNGAAAGNTLEEAILQGFLELVERDSVAIWWYNRLRRPRVELDSFDDPYFRSMQDYYAGLSRELWVLDLTADLGIPAFVAVSRRTDTEVEDIVFAPAAHLDARMGVLRALTELNQMIPGVAGSRGDGTGYAYDDPEAIRWWREATLENQPYLVPADGPARQMADFADRQSDDIREDVLTCQGIVEAAGMEMLVLDQTRPDIGIPVVKVVVPGMRHFWARFAPGRLFDVPVAMGWRDEPIDEDQLNPIPVFI